MKALNTIYFPDTTIFTDRQFPLFLLFAPVHIIQPVETYQTESEETKLTDTFMDEGFCQVHTPAPLGKDRARFLHLINDIKSRKDDYAAQLSALTVASMSTPKNHGDSSKQAIVSSLLGTSGVDIKEGETKRQEELWQARLVLKMGEILDQEEEEIAHALTFLEDTELDLFSRLQGKDEEFSGNNPYEDLVELKKRMNQPKIETINNRLKAWDMLRSMQKSQSSPIWVTTRPEAAEIILENYEKDVGTAPLPFLTTELPARIGKNRAQSFENLKTFSQEATLLQSDLAKHLETLLNNKTVNNKSSLFPEKEGWKSRWKILLDVHFPEEIFGRLPLILHLLVNRQPGSLCGEQQGDDSGHGIIAIIG